MTHTRTATTTIRLLLMVIATTALAIGLAFASPASAQFVDEGGADEADAAPADEEGDAGEHDAGEAPEAAPTGGVDAGFGGVADQGADQGTGLGVLHVLALTLLGVAIAGHVASRRTTPVRA